MSSAAPRRILLVDCDMFFVQVARLEDPEGAGRTPLLIVGGSADGRGVVTSASYEVRAFGVHSAMPTAQALRLCPGAAVVPVPREACVRKSRAIFEALRTLSPRVQPASIDEFYLDLSGTERMLAHESLDATARRIQAVVKAQTEVSVSIGGSTGRLVAKLAAGVAKPAGVHVVPPGEEGAFLRRFELADLPGVGPSLAEELRHRGLRRVEDALALPRAWFTGWLGEKRGHWLYDRIRGIDPTPVVVDEGRKSVSSETTFAHDLTEDGELERVLLELAGSVGRSLRNEALRARTITVKLRDADFTTRSASHTLPDAIESDHAVFTVGRALLGELRKRRRSPARLLGVGASGLVPTGEPEQLGLFAAQASAARPLETERTRTLARVVDDLRDRFGDEAVRPGALLDPPSQPNPSQPKRPT